jgi:RNA-directed DNA polymerase
VNVRPARQLWLPLCVKSDTFALGPVTEHPVGDEQLMERVLERENLVPALKRVEQNKGSAGVDGMTVEELRPFLKASWPGIRQDLLTG